MATNYLSKEDREKLTYATIPICRSGSNGEMHYIGTGFFITNVGIFATAKHVLMDVIDRNGKCIAGISTIQFAPGNTYYHRQIIRFTVNNNADVAVGVLAPMHHNKTKEPLLNTCMTISRRRAIPGEPVITFAYPNTNVANTVGGNSIETYPSEHIGHIAEVLKNGRDKVLLPGPCYRTDMEIPHGASGGPVFNSEGTIFGINSTGFDGTRDFYISSIESIFSIAVTHVSIPGMGDREKITIAELAKLGKIVNCKRKLTHLRQSCN